MSESQRASEMKRLALRIRDARVRATLGLEPDDRSEELLDEAATLLLAGAVDVQTLHYRRWHR